MGYASDTSIVLRLSQPHHPLNPVVRQSLKKLERSGEDLIIFPQILVEFWTVATRPTDVNGLGLKTDEAEAELDGLQKFFRLLPENERIFDEWKTFVVNHKVSGKPSHDARIVAAMNVHKIKNILTLNPGDFKRYGISAITPQEILAETN